MTRTSSLLVPAALLAAALVPAACSKAPPKPQPAMTQPTSTQSGPAVPALTAAQKTAIDAAFAEAAKIIAEARVARESAESIEKASTIQAAYADYRTAKHLYVDAMQIVEEWLQEDYGKLTRPQIDAFMRPYQNDVEKWTHEMARIPKVPPADD